MKRSLFLTGILQLVCGALFAQFTLQDSLIAHYPMSGNAQDISGNANHGTPVGATLTTDRFGATGEAYYLDGINDYITLTSNQKFKPDLPVTMTAWILVEKNGSNMAFQNDWQENSYYGVFLNIANYRITASYGDGGPIGPPTRRTKQGITTLSPNTWYHVAAVIRGPLDMDLYLNGKNDCGTYSGSGGSIAYTAAPGRMGNSDGFSAPGPLVFYKGKIDDLRFYNRALSQQEIASMQDNFAPLIATDTICSGQSLPISVPGGYSSYSWQPAAGLSCSNCQSPVASPTQSTTYKVLMTKAFGCVDTFTYNIVVDTCCQPLTVQPQIIQPISCFGQSDATVQINVANAAAPVQYSLNNGPVQGSNLFTGLSAGTYQVAVADANGCTGQGSIVIQAPANISLSVMSNDVTCFGGNDGNAVATASGGAGGLTYSWSNGASGPAISNLTAQNYVVTVTDAQGCTKTLTVTIDEPDSLEVTINVTPISCNGLSDASLTAAVQGGTSPYSYLWATGQSTFALSGMGPGNYSLVVTDQQGCTGTATAVVVMPPPVTLTVSLIEDVTCYGIANGIALATASGGTGAFSYLWSNGGTFSLNQTLPAGMAQATVTDANGCSATDSIFVSQPDSITIIPGAIDLVSCFGGSDGGAVVSASGGVAPYSFLWANGQTGPQLTGAPAGNIGVTVTDSLGCSVTDFVLIPQADTFIVSFSQVDHVSCFGGNDGAISSVILGGESPFSFLWSNGETSQQIQQISAGFYQLSVTDSTGCVASDSVWITEPDSLVVTIEEQLPVACFGDRNGELLAQVTGGTAPFSFAWSHGDTLQVASGLPAGGYSVSVEDANGCAANAFYSLSQPELLEAEAFVVDSLLCFGDTHASLRSIVTGGTAPIAIAWNTGASSNPVAGLPAGAYRLVVTDARGCLDSTSVEIPSPAPILLEIQTSDPLCFGSANGSVMVFASGGTGSLTYDWRGLAIGDSPVLENLRAGHYVVTVTDEAGCQEDSAIVLFEPNPVDIELIRIEPAFCDNPVGEIHVGTSGGTIPYEFSWDNGGTDSVLVGLMTGKYELTVLDANGCEDQAAFQVPGSYPAKAIASIDPGVRPFLTEDFPIQFQDSSTGATSWHWTFGDGAQSTRPNPVHTYSEPGNYMVLLTVWDADSACPDTDTLFLEFGMMGRVFIPSAFSPNGDGVNDQFSIGGNSITSLQVEIYSRWGILVARLSSPDMGWDGRLIQGGDAPEGVYVFRLTAVLVTGEEIQESGTITLIR